MFLLKIAYSLGGLYAIDIGHLHIHQNGIKALLGYRVVCLGTVANADMVMSHFIEHEPQYLCVDDIVIRNQQIELAKRQRFFLVQNRGCLINDIAFVNSPEWNLEPKTTSAFGSWVRPNLAFH